MSHSPPPSSTSPSSGGPEDDEPADFAEALAAPTPAPGGGAAAARVGLYAASLLRMVTALTRGKPGLESESPELEERLRDVAERALDLSKRFRCLQDDDGKAFLAYLAALRMPRSTPEEEERRDRVKAETLRQATEVPLETIEAALGVLAVAQSLAALARSRRLKAASDVGAAVELARGAFGAAELNVLTNLASIQSEEERRGCEERLRDLRERFEADYEALRREVLGWLEAKSKGKGGA